MGALPGGPPVGRHFVAERGHGGFDAHCVFARVFTVEGAQRVADVRAMNIFSEQVFTEEVYHPLMNRLGAQFSKEG